MSKEDIQELLPEKVFVYDKGPWKAIDIHNSAIDSCTDALVKAEVTVEDVRTVFDKFYQIPMNDTTMGAMMNVALRDKIITALRERFIVLPRPEGK